MSKTRCYLTGGVVFLVTTPLFAQTDLTGSSNSRMTDALVSFLPIGLFLLVLYFFFRRQIKSPLANLQKQNVERHIVHMQRMEELLERIAKGLEDLKNR
jgi:ATP-dependent Zn protease